MRGRAGRGRAGACLRAVLLGLLLGLLLLPGPAAPAAAELVGSVSGTVRAAGGPVAIAWVTLMPVTPTGDWAGQPMQTTTDQLGRYVFGDLSAHHVKIQVRAPSFSGLASTYWPQAYSFATAGILRVAASGSTADVDLPVGASVSGRVVDAATGDPVPGAHVTAHVDAAPGWEPVGSAGLASGPGQFVIDGAAAGPGRPAGAPRGGEQPPGAVVRRCWVPRRGGSGPARDLGTSSIRLREGGEISGVVRDDRGDAVPGAVVTLMGCPALCPLVASTDGTGAYRINGVPAGPGLRAYADAAHAGLLNGWYAGPGQSGDTSFDLAAGQVRSDLDFALIEGCRRRRRILDGETGVPLTGVSVDLVDVGNPLNSYLSRVGMTPGGTCLRGGDGPGRRATPAASRSPPSLSQCRSEFVIGPVPPGQYSLIVYPGRANRDYLPVAVVGSAGLDGPGLVDLAPWRTRRGHDEPGPAGGAASARTAVVGSAATAPPGGDPARPVPSAGWPGLFGGFLAPEGCGLPAAGGLIRRDSARPAAPAARRRSG